MYRKIVKIILGIIIACSIIATSFVLFLHKYTDEYFYNKAEAKISELLDNKQLLSVKENATQDDVKKITDSIKYIYSSELREKIEKEENIVIAQIILQVEYKDKIQKLLQYKDYNTLKKHSDEISELIDKSKSIKNPKVSTYVLKQSQELLSKLEKHNKIKEDVDTVYNKKDSLTLEDVLVYNSVKKLPDLVEYDDLKQELTTKIAELDKKVSEYQKSEKIKEESSFKEAIEAEKNKDTVYDFDKKKSYFSQISASEFRVRDIFNKIDIAQIMVFSYNKLYLYEKDKTSAVGFKKVLELSGRNNILSSRIGMNKTRPIASLEKNNRNYFVKDTPVITTDNNVSSAFIIDEGDFSRLEQVLKTSEVGLIEE